MLVYLSTVKKNYYTILIAWLASYYPPALNAQELTLVPAPVSVSFDKGSFTFDRELYMIFPDTAMHKLGQLFAMQLFESTALEAKILYRKKYKAGSICFTINRMPDVQIGDEGYRLTVNASKIVITANKEAGLFYGFQTLLKLLPATDIMGMYTLRALSITDYPRFKWRGLMLDVTRHFYSVDFVKKYIDEMARYNFNVFHWHLTDDTGWRIAINKYPKLTDVGAWRVPRTGRWGNYEAPGPNEAKTYGGFYTQEEIKEVVQYAMARNISILPEIDMPGHSQAIIAAYPAMSCTGLQYDVFPGHVMGSGPGDNVQCAGNDHTFEVIEGVLAEIAALFPGEYIHIGGDEVDKKFWGMCQLCKTRMQMEGLASPDELQSYFIKRVEGILKRLNKKLVGWDEILEGGLAPDATVMSWRGAQGGIEAAKQGHYVVMSPMQYCYFDFYQGEPSIERNTWGNEVPVSHVYAFEPLPQGIDPKYVLGGQGNVWTEFISNERRVEYMTWPRGLALSEVLWSPAAARDWSSFVPRMEAQLKYFEKQHINYAPSMYDSRIRPVANKSAEMLIEFYTEIPGLDIYYTFDHSFPDLFSQQYNGVPISIPKGATEIWAISYKEGKPAGRLLTIGLDALKSHK